MKGEKVVFLEDYTFNGKLYKRGHIFTITGSDYIRGYNLEDSDGNKIHETVTNMN